MFVYTIKTAVDSGWINSSYLTVAQKGWTGLKTQISTYSDGMPSINSFAPAMSVQNNYSGYVSITPVSAPATTNPHGFAAIMMAASVMEFPLATLPVNFTGFTATTQGQNIILKWQNTDYSEVTNYVVERSENGKDFTSIALIKPQSVNNQWLDIDHPSRTILYYRIKAISSNNKIDYSKIVSVTTQTVLQVNIFPNPIENEIINVSIHDLKKGTYKLTVSNSTGETLIDRSITSSGGIEENIHLPTSSKGIFYFQIKGADIEIKRSILVQ